MSLIKYRTIDGLNLVGERVGPVGAATVILLHGGGQTRKSWAGTMRRLAAAGYGVLAYDARGHGDSDWSPSGDYSLGALSSDLGTVLGTIQGPVALVGASMGGMTAFHAVGASVRPIADALILVDIVLRPATLGRDKIRRFMREGNEGFATLEEAVAAVAAYNPHRRTQPSAEGLRRNLRQRPDGRFYWHWDPRLIRTEPSSEPPAATRELIEVASGVRLPTLLVRGELSDIVDDEGVDEMRRFVPQLETLVVPGAGHMVVGDRNDAFGDAVTTFLAHHLPINA